MTGVAGLPRLGLCRASLATKVRVLRRSAEIQNAVIANEVKQSSGFRHKDAALSGLPRRCALPRFARS